MKFLSRISKPVLVLWLCLFSLVDFKALPNLVLCFGQDGHVELEVAINDRCGDEAQSTRPDFVALNSVGEDHCGECSDIPLISDFAQTESHKSVATSTSSSEIFSLFPSVLTLSFVTRVAEKPRILLSPTPPLILASIRSVRILV